MRLYHVTPTANVCGIHRHGLLPLFSRGKRKAVYLCTRSKIGWAVCHVAADRRLLPQQITIIEVSAPRDWLAKSGHTGVYWCSEVIPTCSFTGHIMASEYFGEKHGQ